MLKSLARFVRNLKLEDSDLALVTASAPYQYIKTKSNRRRQAAA